MQEVFITGTDTNIGKTVFSCILANYLRQYEHLNIGVMKPFASGISNSYSEPVSDDVLQLQNYSNTQDNIKDINPILCQLPLAPAVALEIHPQKCSFEIIQVAFEKLKKKYQFIILEGIGGIKVPLFKNYDVRDLIEYFKFPVIIVASSKLGTLNHTLLTLEYLNAKNITCLGVVLNKFDGYGIEDTTNAQFLSKHVRILYKIKQYSSLQQAVQQASKELDTCNFYSSILK